MATFILHTDGAANNGGGYTDNYAGTWANWHTAFAPRVAETGATYTHASTRISKAGLGTASAVGLIAYVSGTNIIAGRYEITDIIDANTIEVADIVSMDDNTDTVVNVGGALDTVANAYAVTSSGDNLLIVESATDYTISAAVEISTAIQIFGVEAASGDVWTKTSAWNRPRLTTTEAIVMLQYTGLLFMVGLEIDGNEFATQCITITAAVTLLSDCWIHDATGEQIQGLTNHSFGAIEGCKIHGGTYGIRAAASRAIPNIINCEIYDCSTAGIYYNHTSALLIVGTIIYGCGVGLYLHRYSGGGPFVGSTFKNTIDFQFVDGGTNSGLVIFRDCLFLGATALSVASNSTWLFRLYNCAFFNNATAKITGTTPVREQGTKDLTVSPVIDISGDDYRLDSASGEVSDVFYNDTGRYIGALPPIVAAGAAVSFNPFTSPMVR